MGRLSVLWQNTLGDVSVILASLDFPLFDTVVLGVPLLLVRRCDRSKLLIN